jgi:hypothetical protein
MPKKWVFIQHGTKYHFPILSFGNPRFPTISISTREIITPMILVAKRNHDLPFMQ